MPAVDRNHVVMLDPNPQKTYRICMHVPEQLVIRPPSEAASLLIRTVRGCNWNRCLFCGIYDLYGVPYSQRTPQEVKDDIDAFEAHYGDRFETAFLGDANPMDLPTDFLVDILSHLRKKFPSLKRVTVYGRASSLWKKSLDELRQIHDAGLDRVHTGMESGSNRVLAFHKKGTNQKQLIEAGQKARDAGLELSYYFLLGLGGKTMWREHVIDSAGVINLARPHFVRVRRLWIHPMSRLMQKVDTGEFVPQEPEGTVIELRDLVESLDAPGTTFACDHANNYIQVFGKLNDDKKHMLSIINTFLALPPDKRNAHYHSIPSVI